MCFLLLFFFTEQFNTKGRKQKEYICYFRDDKILVLVFHIVVNRRYTARIVIRPYAHSRVLVKFHYPIYNRSHYSKKNYCERFSNLKPIIVQ